MALFFIASYGVYPCLAVDFAHEPRYVEYDHGEQSRGTCQGEDESEGYERADDQRVLATNLGGGGAFAVLT